MATPRSFTPLALPQPRVRDATKPITGADEGVSLRIYDLVDEGATVHIDPPSAGDLAPGDVMKLYLIGDAGPLDSTIIKAGEENSITTLHIPRGRLHPDRFNEIYFTITRGSNNIGTSTPPVTLLYNKIRPGLKDTKPEVDGHSELELLLPDIIKNGITPDFPVAGVQVCVSYPYCRAYDRIRLKCNGADLYYDVLPSEAPPPPNPGSAVPIRVCFTVTRAFLESTTRPSQTLDFAYTVTDQLGNTPDTDAIWSASQTVDEDLAGTRLPAPILREQLNDTGDDAGTIELEKLKGGPLLVVILTSDNRFNVGDTLTATYTAKLTGQPDVRHEATGTVEADEFGQKKTCVLEVPNDKVIADSNVTVRYVLSGTGSGQSREATAKVRGESVIDFPPPTIEQAPNNVSLDPMAATQKLTLLVPGTLQPSDLLQVTWSGAPGDGSYTSPPQPVSVIGQKIEIPVSVIAFNLGKAVTVSYSVSRDGAPAKPSLPRVLNVLTIPNEDSRFPTPSISRAQGNELDVTRLLGTDTLLIARWPFPLVSQCVWLTLRCARADGGPEEWVVWTGEAHNYEPGITQPLAYFLTWLQGCKDGATLSIIFGVNLDKVANAATRVMFPVRTYTVKAIAMVDPTITSIKGSPSGVEIPDGKETTETSLTLTGTASAGQTVQLYNGGSPIGGIITVGADRSWIIMLTNLAVATYSFVARGLYGTQPQSPARTLTVIRPVLSENFDSVPSQSISTVKIDLPSMTLFAVSADRWGYLGEPIHGPTIPGELENNCVILAERSIVIRMELKSTYVHVGFSYRALQGVNRPSVSFYDDKGILMMSGSLPDSHTVNGYGFTSIGGIKYIELKTGNSDFLMVDNFSFKI